MQVQKMREELKKRRPPLPLRLPSLRLPPGEGLLLSLTQKKEKQIDASEGKKTALRQKQESAPPTSSLNIFCGSGARIYNTCHGVVTSLACTGALHEDGGGAGVLRSSPQSHTRQHLLSKSFRQRQVNVDDFFPGKKIQRPNGCVLHALFCMNKQSRDRRNLDFLSDVGCSESANEAKKWGVHSSSTEKKSSSFMRQHLL